MDILCAGFPCQDVSTVGKQAGLAPGTRSGLWSHMATAIELKSWKAAIGEQVGAGRGAGKYLSGFKRGDWAL